MLVAAAFVFLRPSELIDDPDGLAAGAWVTLPDSGLSGRSDASAVWTRKAMIVWGGATDAGVLGDGASFDLSTQTWTPLPAAPLAPRRSPSAVWTGTMMLVYGGLGRGAECPEICTLGDGAAYDPVANSWTPLSPSPLASRSGHSAVWVQNRMIVWGGAGEDGGALGDGASYDPATDTWALMPPAPLAPRVNHRSVASTDRMLVWGGSSEAVEGGSYFADGAVYSPAADSWTAMAPAPASVATRDTFASVWTGRQMLVWGGFGRSDACTPCFHGDGAAYDPDADSWALIGPSPLGGRGGAKAVWTGRDMLVWGGFDGAVQADGALYNPTGDSWARVVPGGPLEPRQGQAMVWTGRQLLIWGGQGAGAGRLRDGAVLTLTAF